MKRVVFTVLFCVIFAVPSFAQGNYVLDKKALYLTFDNYLHNDASYSISGGASGSDSEIYYNPGVTLGINVQDYFNVETSVSFFPSDVSFEDGLFDVMLVYQEPVIKNSYDLTPYFGAGLGVLWGSNSYEVGYYDTESYSAFGMGIGIKGGARFYSGQFLLGVGAELHFYPLASIDYSSSRYTGSHTVDLTLCTFKLGFNVGVVF